MYTVSKWRPPFPTVDRMWKHEWKHYIPRTSLAVGNHMHILYKTKYQLCNSQRRLRLNKYDSRMRLIFSLQWSARYCGTRIRWRDCFLVIYRSRMKRMSGTVCTALRLPGLCHKRTSKPLHQWLNSQQRSFHIMDFTLPVGGGSRKLTEMSFRCRLSCRNQKHGSSKVRCSEM